MFNLLTEPLIRMDTTAGTPEPATLPQVYEALIANKVDAFPALRPHQRHAWHAFLVQLGALALHRAGRSMLPTTAAEWCELIRGLTPDYPNGEPWQLIVEDITVPAFMQSPTSPDRRKEYKPVKTLDGLDVLITSTNHHLKWIAVSSSEINDLIFALISLQTMGRYSKAGRSGNYYHISRVNRNFGNRPAFSLTPSMRQGIHVRRDIGALLECREELLEEYPDYPRDGGVQLVWTKCWTGREVEALQRSDLDIFYIEICHRIRLENGPDGVINATRAPSKKDGARIYAKNFNGITGDPWTPTSRGEKENKSLTLALGGFTYKIVAECLSSAWQPPPLFKPTAAERSSPQDMLLVARGMVRGRGKTQGYYERIIPFRKQAVRAFGRPRGIQELGDIARDRVKQIRIVQDILSESIAVFVAQGEHDLTKIEFKHYELTKSWVNRLDSIVERSFFEDLQIEFAANEKDERERIHNDWLRGVVDTAERILQDAAKSLPCPSMQRFRALVNAEEHFKVRKLGPKGLPFLFENVEKDDKECPSNNQPPQAQNPEATQIPLFQ